MEFFSSKQLFNVHSTLLFVNERYTMFNSSAKNFLDICGNKISYSYFEISQLLWHSSTNMTITNTQNQESQRLKPTERRDQASRKQLYHLDERKRQCKEYFVFTCHLIICIAQSSSKIKASFLYRNYL